MTDILDIATRAEAIVKEAREALEAAESDIKLRQAGAERLRALVRAFDRVAEQQTPALWANICAGSKDADAS